MRFVDLETQRERLNPLLNNRLQAVLRHGRFIAGPEVTEFEQALCKELEVPHCITCANGTDALVLSLRALGLQTGDAVLVPGLTYVATANAVALTGATPVFVDIEPASLQMSTEDLRRALGELDAGQRRAADGTVLQPRAVIAVGLFGLPPLIDGIQAVAESRGLRVIEDGAQCLAARVGEQVAPCQGELGTTSFFPSKPLGCYGDGGAVFTRDRELARVLRLLAAQGIGSTGQPAQLVGMNSRLDTLQAAILLAKLSVFSDELERRRRLAALYQELLSPLEEIDCLSVPSEVQPTWSHMTVTLAGRLANQRDTIMRQLEDFNIPTRIYYETPLHLQPAFKPLGYTQGQLPICERMAQRVLSLPMHPYLTTSEVESVVARVQQALNSPPKPPKVVDFAQ